MMGHRITLYHWKPARSFFAEGVAAKTLLERISQTLSNMKGCPGTLCGRPMKPFAPYFGRAELHGRFDEPCLGLSMFATRSTGLVTAWLREPFRQFLRHVSLRQGSQVDRLTTLMRSVHLATDHRNTKQELREAPTPRYNSVCRSN
jgi:hypothetical protein